MGDKTSLIANLRSLARFEHADLSIGDEAADALEVAAVVDGERAHWTKVALDYQSALQDISATVSIGNAHAIAGRALSRTVAPAGKYLCPTCDGGGEIAPDADCPDCDGIGYVYVVPKSWTEDRG